MAKTEYFDCALAGQKKIRAAWRDYGGMGRPVLLTHGFGGAFASWDALRRIMGPGYHFYILDLNGRPEEGESVSSVLSPYEQSDLIREFIRRRRLDNILLIGHSMGATAAALAAAGPFVRQRLYRLILIAPTGMDRALPAKVAALSGNSPEHNFLLRDAGAELTAFRLLSLVAASPDRISDEMIHAVVGELEQPGAKDVLTGAARQLFIPDKLDFCRRLRNITTETFIVWGSEDRITSPDNGELFRKEIPRSTLKILPDCGHIPHMENPIAFLALFRKDKSVQMSDAAENESSAIARIASKSKLKMSRLFDRWSPGAVFFFLFIKFLQFLRKCGIKGGENGWRKATGIFMRNEYSKFILSSFRLRYSQMALPPASMEQAKKELVSRLQKFLSGRSSLLWSAVPGFFTLGRQKTFFCDIVIANYAIDGKLVSLEPCFDESRGGFSILTQEQIQGALEKIVRLNNRLSRVSALRRALSMKQNLKRWSKKNGVNGYAEKMELELLIDRLMTASYLHCDILPESEPDLQKKRLKTPNVKKYRHPGWGLLNIFCRFTAGFEEADLWVQFHHVPVDGAQMQEMLDELKHEWGTCGSILFPAIGSPAARPEVFHCGGKLFRARFFIDFSRIMKLRDYLNCHYTEEMNGKVTIAGMILWGLSKHPYFSRRKMLFPVDIHEQGSSGERELSLVFIRPDKYSIPENPLKGFLAFQKAFNLMVEESRHGRGESIEFLNLCSMAHPVFYHLADWLLPNTLREIVGTAGVSIIRNAEMFISPLSSFQTAGFMAMGSVNMPTVDGGRAGAVTVCASRVQVRYYIKAMSEMAENYSKFLDLKLGE